MIAVSDQLVSFQLKIKALTQRHKGRKGAEKISLCLCFAQGVGAQRRLKFPPQAGTPRVRLCVKFSYLLLAEC